MSTLKIYNSLTKSKQVFTPNSQKSITWYTCGPTVYDKTHMGHARCYITFDILRRILQKHFQYHVTLVMNITDIDDKIIVNARQNKLVEQFTEKTKDTIKLVEYIRNLISDYKLDKLQGRWPDTTPPMPKPEKWELYIQTVTKAENALKEQTEPKIIIDQCKDIIAPDLDKLHGHTINDHKIFQTLATKYEKMFTKDMNDLNVLPPTLLTRVSEYVPEVVEFIQGIMKNGYAYEADQSVYFDVNEFSKTHTYAKLNPAARGNLDSMAESEGSLGAELRGKKRQEDFALWKRSKEGEPFWNSPWGKGRPGWHIECSAMASAILGSNFDIHSGGIDLCFPHHDNEMAQSEAYYNNQNWVNYFLHAGHLHIEGLKMSKSLKNFITIEEALQEYTANEIRWLFLVSDWHETLEFSKERVEVVKGEIKQFTNFFGVIRSLLWSSKDAPHTGKHSFHEQSRKLFESLAEARDQVDEKLCDSFNTRGVMQILSSLMSAANKYISSHEASRVSVEVLLALSEYITETLKMFGLDTTALSVPSIHSSLDSNAPLSIADKENIIMPYVQCLSQFRDTVRDKARSSAIKAKTANPDTPDNTSQDLLKLCDQLRDVELVNLNVLLEDREAGQPAIAKMRAKEEILEEKKKLESKKLASSNEHLNKRKDRLEKGRKPSQELYKTAEYIEWDAEGVPTKDAKGEEITKSGRKKLIKGMEAQKKLHEEFNQAKEKGEIE